MIRHTLVAVSFILCCTSSSVLASEANCAFVGEYKLEPVWHLPEYQKEGDRTDIGDYEHRLHGGLTYRDCSGETYAVPDKVVVNGASIPRGAWSLIGYTPFSGRLQRPSILHDHLCETVQFTAEKVHRLFYETLISEDVPKTDALLMYAAVNHFGPQWNEPGDTVTWPSYVGGLMDFLSKLIANNQAIVSHTRFGVDPASTAEILHVIDYEKSGVDGPIGPEQVRDYLHHLKRLSDAELKQLDASGSITIRSDVRKSE